MIRALTLISCLALLVQGGRLAAEERLRDLHILGVGINDFISKNAPHLNRPVSDVNRMAAYFGRQDFDSNTPKREPRLVFNEKATKKEIERQLADLPNWVAERGTAVILLSSHGTRDGGNWYFVTHDCDVTDLDGSCVSGKTMMQSIDALIAKKHCRVLVIVNACYSGQILTAAEPLFDKYRDPAQGGLILLASCIPNEESMENAAGGIFFTTVMQGLEMMQAHVQPTGSVSVKEIRRYLRAELQNQMRFTFCKAPGLDWEEQYSLVECSLSIPEDLGLTYADPKLVMRVNANLSMDANSKPTNMKVIKTDASPVGVWECSRPLIAKFKGTSNEPEAYYSDDKGNVLVEKLVLTLGQNGRYSVSFADVFGKTQTGAGHYRFLPGVEFSLIYDTGIDYFSVDKLTADEIVLRNPILELTPSPDVLNQINQGTARLDPVFKFTRVKDK